MEQMGNRARLGDSALNKLERVGEQSFSFRGRNFCHLVFQHGQVHGNGSHRLADTVMKIACDFSTLYIAQLQYSNAESPHRCFRLLSYRKLFEKKTKDRCQDEQYYDA